MCMPTVRVVLLLVVLGAMMLGQRKGITQAVNY
jgi:hypothetical protein